MNPFELETGTKQEYYQFLQSETWSRLREAVMKRDRQRCRICSCKDDLQVHHVRYQDERGRRDWQNMGFLYTLCRPCHQIITEAVEKARNLHVEIPSFSISLYQIKNINSIQGLIQHNLYGKQQELAAETIFSLYLRSLRGDAKPINICDCETHRYVAALVLLTLEYQAGWYTSWRDIATKAATDRMVVEYRRDTYIACRKKGWSDEEYQRRLGLNNTQMANVKKNARRLIGDGGSG